MEVKIVRLKETEKETLGVLYIDGDFICNILELSWKDNQHNISCIPTGTYRVVKRYNQKHKHHFHILNVPNRSWILIHTANYYSQIRGCQIPGTKLLDINNDGELDVVNSTIALGVLNDLLPDDFDIKIINNFDK